MPHAAFVTFLAFETSELRREHSCLLEVISSRGIQVISKWFLRAPALPMHFILLSAMSSQPSCTDIVRYLISYSQPNLTLHISATALSLRPAIISSFRESGIHHVQNMSTEYPASGGLRNGFGRYRMANHDQSFHIDVDRFLGYPNAFLDNNGHWTPTPMSYTPIMPQGSAPIQNAIFNTPMANGDRRRRSSAISPRTIRAPTNRMSYSNSFPPSGPQTLTSLSSNNFPNNNPQAQAEVEPRAQAFNRPSLSTISSTVRASTASAYTGTPTTQHGHNQRAVFALLSEICTEALRRKWHDETQQQLIRSLYSRSPRPSRHRRHSCDRFSPYATQSAIPRPRSRGSQRMQRRGTIVPERPLLFMELMQRIATAMWEDVTQRQRMQGNDADIPNSASVPASAMAITGDAETAAIDSMRTLYSLGNSILAATEAASYGENFNFDEVRDIAGVAAGFCRVLGYGEGAERCEEVVRRPFGAEPEHGDYWERGVL